MGNRVMQVHFPDLSVQVLFICVEFCIACMGTLCLQISPNKFGWHITSLLCYYFKDVRGSGSGSQLSVGQPQVVDGIGSMNSLAAANHGKQGKSAAWGWQLKVTKIILPVPNQISMDWILFLCFVVLVLGFFKFLFLLQATIMYFFLC